MDSLQRLREIRALKGSLEDSASVEGIIKQLREITEVSAMAKAGYVLRDVGAASWNANGRNCVTPLRMGIVSNFTCGEVEHYLRFNMLRERICPEFYVGDFDQYIVELMDPESGLVQFSPDITMCLLDEHVVTECLAGEWGIADMRDKLDEVAESLHSLFSRYASNTRGMLIINTVPLSAGTYHSVIDYNSKAQLGSAWREFNMRLLKLAFEHKNIVVIDTDLFLQKPGVRLREARMAAYAKMYLDESLLAEIAFEVRKVAQSIVGKTNKCLVLDCDNTLWGGVIGDDGMEGIVLGDSPEGEAYVAFHKAIKRLGKQGIILAINSKNDKVNTDRVFDAHPDTYLTQNDFIAQCVNWEPKHLNLKEIAARINIGTDHMVFVDDSSFECNLVKDMVPEVHVIQLNGEAAEYAETLLEGGWFNTLELTNEDYQRTGQYKSEMARENFRAAHEYYEDYLRELSISVVLFMPDELSIARVAQLTQRTNQFNLTGWRLSEQEVQQMMTDQNWLIIGIRSGDRFGDNGIVGALFVRRIRDMDGGLAFVIKNFLLSCRVFSRGIETSSLREVLVWAHQQGAKKVFGEYIQSSKNGKYVDFFRSNGFQAVEQNAADPAVYFHTLQQFAEPLSWIDVNPLFLEAEGV